MRFRSSFCLFLILLLLPCLAAAELELSLSAECLAAESVLDFTVSGESGSGYCYTIHRDGKELFSHETPLSFGSYLPRESGQYTLTAAIPGTDESVSAAFTVTDKLACTLSEPPSRKAGEPIHFAPQVSGGTGIYQYTYALTTPDGKTSAWTAGADWPYVPAEAGAYHLALTVEDSIGARATAEADFTVAEGPGITLKSCGGALRAHGGQQSWIVYAPGEWTASTEDAFIQLDTASGHSGSVLTVTVDTPAESARSGSVTIVSSDRQVTHKVLQSAQHGVDEELSLLPAAETLLVDGAVHTAWLQAQESKTFAVAPATGWTAQTENDFIHVETGDGTVTLTVDAPQTSAARSGLVTIANAACSAWIHVYQPGAPVAAEEATASVLPQEAARDFTLYSQFSGYWKDKPYGSSTLEQSGCALFALSHALQCLGFEGEKITPEYFAANYAFALRDGGTINSTLVGNVGDDLGYKTRFELYDSLSTIQKKINEGALFSFAVVNGHIAMIAGQSEDGTMFRVIDSAPSATWERIKNGQLYKRNEDGSFSPISDLTELEGIRYYIENGAFGGTEYWMDAAYITRRGVRLIQPETP